MNMKQLKTAFGVCPKKLGAKDCFPIGQYQGKPLGVVLKQDPSYIIWFSNTVTSYRIKKKVVHEAQLIQQHIEDTRFYNKLSTPNPHRRYRSSSDRADYSEHDYEIGAYELCVDHWGD